MRRRTKIGIVGAAGVGMVLVGSGLALAGNPLDDDATDAPITGAALDRASAAALAHTGSGHVTETEVGDEEGYYEVEVTLDDGSQVDVHLDRSFKVVGADSDGPAEAGD